jgi:hypothetical protein
MEAGLAESRKKEEMRMDSSRIYSATTCIFATRQSSMTHQNR